jgi:CRP-like cAMP-binding protein
MVPKGLLLEKVRLYPKNNVLLFQGEIPRHGYYVQSGVVKIYAIDNNGTEKVVGFCSMGDFFPIDWLLKVVSNSRFYYETVVDSEIIPLYREAFTSSMVQNSAISSYIQTYLAHDSSTQLLRHLALQQPTAQYKILFFLYFLAVRFGKEVSPGILNPGIPLTHQLISENLGLTRETVSFEMIRLKKSGAILYRKKRYLIDKQLLISTVGKDMTAILEQKEN